MNKKETATFYFNKLMQGYNLLEKKQAKLEQVVEKYNQSWKKKVKQGEVISAINEWRRFSELQDALSQKCFLSTLKEISSFGISADKLVSNGGNLFFFEYMSLPDGLYRIQMEFEEPESSLNSIIEDNNESVWFRFDVSIDMGYVIYYTEVYQNQKQFEFFIDLLAIKDLQIRFWANGVPFAVKFIKLSLIYQPSDDRAAADYYFDLGKAFHEQGNQMRLLTAWQKALELNPGVYLEKLPWILQKASEIQPSGMGYFNFGMFLAQQNRLEQALICYQKALEINIDEFGHYSELGLLLIQKGWLSQVIDCFNDIFSGTPNIIKYFQNFSNLLLDKGFIEECRVFCEYIQKVTKTAKIYEDIWKGLNQLEYIEEDNPDYLTEIEPESAFKYFQLASTYKVVSLQSLTEDDKNYLENIGLSLANVELIAQDNFPLQEMYVNSFDAPNKQILPNINLTAPYQQVLVEHGYIYSVCPFSGKVIRSNQSFVINHQDIGHHDLQGFIYRFVGREIFYLMYGCTMGEKLLIYFPNRELIINLVQGLIPFARSEQSINKFKAYIVSYRQQVKSYLEHEEKKVVNVVGLGFNLGHYLWQELTALDNLSKNGILSKIHKILIGPGEYFSIGDIFPEISPEKMTQIKDVWDVFKTVVDNNYVAFRANASFIEEQLINRIGEVSVKKCTQDFLTEVETAKKHFPLLGVQIRTSSRVWLGQAEGIANIIKSLYSDFPNLGVVFDGWSLTGNEDSLSINWSIIESEKAVMEEILSLIPPTINTYNAIGATTYETVVWWTQAIDVGITPLGAGVTFSLWIANNPNVIVHAATPFLNWCADEIKTSKSRENLKSQILVPKESIVDANNYNYDCDWEVIYKEVLKLIQNLTQERG